MNKLKILLAVIAIFLVGANISLYLLVNNSFGDPLFKYSNSSHSINYFFDLNKISVVLDKANDTLELRNPSGDKVIVMEAEMNPSMFVNRGMLDWKQVTTDNNTVLLVPPSECKYYQISIKIDGSGKNTFTLSDIMSSWNPCKK